MAGKSESSSSRQHSHREFEDPGKPHPPSHLKCYADYLVAVLHEGDGHISSEQYESLNALKAKHHVTNEQHRAILEAHGWSEEQYQNAARELPPEYVTFLKAILIDGMIDENEARTLAHLKKKHQLSDADHRRALQSLGYTERDYLVACAKGAASRTILRFGRSSTKIIEGEVDKDEYCRGLFVAPYAHQWYEVRNGEVVMARAPGSDMRTSSTLESFYDLVVVAVVDRIVHLFADDNSRWLPFLVMFSTVWRIWSSTMVYNSLWESEDLTAKIVMFIQMLGLVWMAISAEDAFNNEGSNSFGAGFVISTLPLLVFFIWAFIRRKRGYQWALIQALFVSFSPILVIVSMAFHGHARGPWFMIWWLIATLLPETLPLAASLVPFMAKHQYPLNIEHATERYSVLTLIFLGETIASLMVELPWDSNLFIWQIFVSLAAGLAASTAIKWIYFDIDAEKKQHPLRRSAWHSIAWSLSHAPLCLAIATSAAGFYGIQTHIIDYVEKVVLGRNTTYTDSNGLAAALTPSTLPERNHDILFCVGLGGALIFLTMQALVSKHHKYYLVPPRIRIGIRFIMAITIALLPIGTYGMGGLPLVISAAGLLVALALFEMIAMLPGSESDSIANLDSVSIEVLKDFILIHYSEVAGVSIEDEKEMQMIPRSAKLSINKPRENYERFTDYD